MNTSWSHTTRVVIIVMILAGAIWLAFIASPLLDAILVSALLAYLMSPICTWLMRRSGMKRPQAAGIVFVASMLIVIAIPAVLGTVAVNSIGRLRADFLRAADEIELWLFRPIDILGFHLQPQQMLEPLQAMGASLLASVPVGSLSIISSVTTNLLWAVTVLIMYYYFLKDGNKIKPWLVTLAPVAHQQEYEILLDKVDHVWGKFLRIQLLMFLVIFLLMLVGTLLIVGLFRFGLLRWSPLGFIALLVLLYTAIQQLDNLWIRPHILGKQMRLHPGIVFAGLVGALMVGGLLGALLIVPLLATTKVVGRYVHRKLLGLPAWPAAPAEELNGKLAPIEASPPPEKEQAYQS